MSAPPKPTKRGAKPKRPIKRSGSPIARRAKPARVRRSKAGQAKHRADRAWSRAVKAKGPCVALQAPPGGWLILKGEDQVYYAHGRCWGPTDAAHVLSRTFPATRDDISNGIPLCRAAHNFFTSRPLAFENFCRQLLGDQEYDRLYAKAHGNI